MTMIRCKSIIAGLVRKLPLFRQNIGRGDFSQFPLLGSCPTVTEADRLCYVEHLMALEQDLLKRFTELLHLEIPAWVIDPFHINAHDFPEIEEELIDLQVDEELKVMFQTRPTEFWYEAKYKLPKLWDLCQMYIMAFPTTYLVEKGFSSMTQLLTKQRNRLEICQRGDLRLMLTSIEPSIVDLAKQHQAQGSH